MGGPQIQPYKPADLPIQNIDWSAFIELMGKANRYIARYDGLLQSIVNPEVLLSPLITQEAVLSSKIEGVRGRIKAPESSRKIRYLYPFTTRNSPGIS